MEAVSPIIHLDAVQPQMVHSIIDALRMVLLASYQMKKS